jgi:hypothetical protein
MRAAHGEMALRAIVTNPCYALAVSCNGKLKPVGLLVDEEARSAFDSPRAIRSARRALALPNPMTTVAERAYDGSNNRKTTTIVRENQPWASTKKVLFASATKNMAPASRC